MRVFAADHAIGARIVVVAQATGQRKLVVDFVTKRSENAICITDLPLPHDDVDAASCIVRITQRGIILANDIELLVEIEKAALVAEPIAAVTLEAKFLRKLPKSGNAVTGFGGKGQITWPG